MKSGLRKKMKERGRKFDEVGEKDVMQEVKPITADGKGTRGKATKC